VVAAGEAPRGGVVKTEVGRVGAGGEGGVSDGNNVPLAPIGAGEGGRSKDEVQPVRAVARRKSNVRCIRGKKRGAIMSTAGRSST